MHICCWWVGSTQPRTSWMLRSESAIEGHPRIVCTGFVPDAAPYYRAMDLMVLPSWREGFPNAILEAAATGVPVVATICTGSRDAVIPEVTGLLVPPGYPDAICEAVMSLLRDPDRRRRMSAAARRWVIENYDDRRVLGMAVAFYKSLSEAPDAGRTGRRSSEGGRRRLLVCLCRCNFSGNDAAGGACRVCAPASVACRIFPGAIPRTSVAPTANKSAAPTAIPICINGNGLSPASSSGRCAAANASRR